MMSYEKKMEETKEKHREVLKRSLRLAIKLAREENGLATEEIAEEIAAWLTQDELESICSVWAKNT